MSEELTELQQFFGAYFNQDWAEDHPSADEVIDKFLQDSPIEIIVQVKQEILELVDSYTNAKDLQDNLLHTQHCYFYYPYSWASGLLWLNYIIEKFDNHLKESMT